MKWRTFAVLKVTPTPPPPTSLSLSSLCVCVNLDTITALITGATMERDQDVQGQVTQMRFSLSLMLHQMEVCMTTTFRWCLL